MGKCKFRSDWLLKQDNHGFKISSWGQKHNDNELFCKICACKVNVQNQGFHAVLQHADSSRHKKLCQDALGPNQLHLSAASPDSSQNAEGSSVPQSASSSAMSLFSVKDSSTAAELIWTMKAVCSNYSAASCQNIAQTFHSMFPGDVSKEFSLSPKKMHYLLTDALAVYFRDIMLGEVNGNSLVYTLSFDETTNVENKKELQITIRYWSESKSEIVCRHLETFFIGKADATTLHSKINSALSNANLPLHKLLMIGSDGPNVNKKVLRLFNEDIISIRSKGLIDIGTCPIHIVHNAYLKALESLGEDASELVLSVYHYFHGWPSRFEEYEKVQEELKLPANKFMKHSSTRWLTFEIAARRLIEQWEGITYYFLKQIPLKKKCEMMQTTSYKKIASLLRSPCIKAELNFAVSSAELFTKFTRSFQRDEPLVHMLYSELLLVVQTLVGRVCKADVLKDVQSTAEFDENLLFGENNLIPVKEVILSLSPEVKKELLKLNEKDKLLFLKRAQSHYIAGCKHIIQKTSISSKLVKALRCLHPEERKKRRSCRDIITIARSLPFDVAEDEWKLLQLENDDPESRSLRIESYWNRFLIKVDAVGSPKFRNIAKVVKAALTLSHGNADVERRFSVSRWTLTEDKSAMSERTLNAILITKDALRSQFSNCPHLVPITKKLISLAQSARKHYQSYLDNVKREKEKEEKMKIEEERLKKELEEKQKKAEAAKKHIEKDENELKLKREDHERTKDTAHVLFQEATERLKKALQKGDLNEANLAQAMLEGVNKMQEVEKEKSKEVESLQKSVEKRKSNLITSFFSKKPKQ